MIAAHGRQMFVDSHCHLNYLDDPEAALLAARDAGVREMLCIGTEEAHIEAVLAFTAEPGVWATIGEHPGNASGEAGWVSHYLSRAGVVAVGETGLDYFYVKEADAQRLQRTSFSQQMALAQANDLPVVIHTRDAQEDTLQIMREYPGVRGVLHCFTEDWAMAEAALALGYFISISGIVTFRNAGNVRDVAERVPAERLLIETDSPWLAPVPHRGKQNQPAFVADTGAFVATLRGCDIAVLAEQTRANFFELFARAAGG